MRDDGSIGPERAGDDRSGHARLGWRRTALLIHLQIRRLNHPREQSFMRLAALGTGKAVKHRLDGKLRRHFTLLLATDTVSKNEDASMRAQLLRCVGQQVAEVVLV